MGERKRMLNSREAMEYVGWRRTKFWHLVKTGQIVGLFDGQWRFDITELEKYKKRKTQQAS